MFEAVLRFTLALGCLLQATGCCSSATACTLEQPGIVQWLQQR